VAVNDRSARRILVANDRSVVPRAGIAVEEGGNYSMQCTTMAAPSNHTVTAQLARLIWTRRILNVR